MKVIIFGKTSDYADVPSGYLHIETSDKDALFRKIEAECNKFTKTKKGSTMSIMTPICKTSSLLNHGYNIAYESFDNLGVLIDLKNNSLVAKKIYAMSPTEYPVLTAADIPNSCFSTSPIGKVNQAITTIIKEVLENNPNYGTFVKEFQIDDLCKAVHVKLMFLVHNSFILLTSVHVGENSIIIRTDGACKVFNRNKLGDKALAKHPYVDRRASQPHNISFLLYKGEEGITQYIQNSLQFTDHQMAVLRRLFYDMSSMPYGGLNTIFVSVLTSMIQCELPDCILWGKSLFVDGESIEFRHLKLGEHAGKFINVEEPKGLSPQEIKFWQKFHPSKMADIIDSMLNKNQVP